MVAEDCSVMYILHVFGGKGRTNLTGRGYSPDRAFQNFRGCLFFISLRKVDHGFKGFKSVKRLVGGIATLCFVREMPRGEEPLIKSCFKLIKAYYCRCWFRYSDTKDFFFNNRINDVYNEP